MDNLRKYSIETLFEDEDDLGITLSNFSLLESGTEYQLNAVYFANNNDGLAVGDSGTVVMTEDGGSNWKSIKLEIGKKFNDCYLSNTGKAIVVGQDGTVLYSDNYFVSYEAESFPAKISLFRVYF